MLTGLCRPLVVLLLSLCLGCASVRASSRQVKRQASSGSPYPTFTSVPKTSFSCDQYGPGYYADLETGCQVFHVCHTENVDSFICSPGTLFNQKVFVCDWWYNVDCGASAQFYYLNSLIGREDATTGPSGAAQGRRTGSASSGNGRKKATEQSASAIGSQSRTSVSRTRTESRSENDLSYGRSDAFKQGVTERVDAGVQEPTVAVIGQDENYEVLSGSRGGSTQDGYVTGLEENFVSGVSSAGRPDEVSRWGSVSGNAITTEQRGSGTPTSPALNSPSSYSRASRKGSSTSVPSNSLRPNTSTKKKVASKTSSSFPSILSSPEASNNNRIEPKQTSRTTPRPTARSRLTTVRSFRPTPFTVFQSSTSRPFRPTIPRFTRPQSSTGTTPKTPTPQPVRPDAQESSGPVGNVVSRIPAPSPKQPEQETFKFSTQRLSTAQPVTSRPSSPRPSTARSVTSRPKNFRPSDPRTVISRPQAFRPSTPRPSTPRPSTPQPAQSGPINSRPSNSQPPVGRPEEQPPASSGRAGGDLSPPQYQFDRVRAELAGRLAGVEPLDVPADRLVSETRPAAAPGRLVFSARGQTQPEWLYALGGLVL